jgi:hypothetical protein
MLQNCGVARITQMVCYSFILRSNFTISKTVSQHLVQEVAYMKQIFWIPPKNKTLEKRPQILWAGIRAHVSLSLHHSHSLLRRRSTVAPLVTIFAKTSLRAL